MAPPPLTLKDVHVTFGSTPLLSGAEFAIEPGEKLCLIGRNGSGKSTLMKVAAGIIEPDKGERFVHPGARVAYLTQEVNFSGYATTLAYVEAGLGPQDDSHVARRILEDLGLTGAENPESLSGGEARRVALARVLAPAPDVLLLDEPTNHLDLPAIEWLEAELRSFRGALVLISHDRRFLENLSRVTVWLDRGTARRLSAGFKEFEAWRDKVLEDEETERHKLDRKIVREDQWMHGGVTARRKRNVRRVRELRTMREERKNQTRVQGNVKLDAAEAGISGRLVFEAAGISKSYGGVKIVDNLSLRVMRGDRLGLVGPNGAGKTTLIKLLTGEIAPDCGTVRLGTNLEMIALDQRRDELKPEWTVADALTGGRGDQVVINGKARHVASYMKDFLFLPEQARSPCRVLSGGERARLMLARALAKPSNVLVLDEPTNDLDLETLDLLQEMLADYSGTVLLVSHDRDFLDRVVTSTLASGGDGKWIEYAGGYSDMLAQRRGAAPAKADATAKSSAPAKSGAARNGPPPAGSNLANVSEPAIALAAPKRKLSFKDKHALETLPAEIEKLTAEIASLEKTLADPDLFTKDPAGFQKATTRAAKAHEDLAAAEERWLELEMLRQELEG